MRDQYPGKAAGGEWLRMEGVAGLDYIVCLSFDEGKNTITENGNHHAIRVGDIVFDNLHPDGMKFDAWLADFLAVGGVRIASVEAF